MKPKGIQLTGRLERRGGAADGQGHEKRPTYGVGRLGIRKDGGQEILEGVEDESLDAIFGQARGKIDHRGDDAPAADGAPGPARSIPGQGRVRGRSPANGPARGPRAFGFEAEAARDEAGSAPGGLFPNRTRLFRICAGIMGAALVIAGVRWMTSGPSAAPADQRQPEHPASVAPPGGVANGGSADAGNSGRLPSNIGGEQTAEPPGPTARPATPSRLAAWPRTGPVPPRRVVPGPAEAPPAETGKDTSEFLSTWLKDSAPASQPAPPGGETAGAGTAGPPAARVQQASQPAGPATLKYRDCPPGIRVTGVINCSDGPVATINDRLVRVGGVVNGAKVVKINDFAVEMELDGERFVVGIGAGGPDPEEESDSASEKAAPDQAPDPHKPTAASKPAGPGQTPAPAGGKSGKARRPVTPTPSGGSGD